MSPDRMWKRMWVINFTFLALLSGALLILAILHLVEVTFAVTFVFVLLVGALILYFRQRSSGRFRPDERIRRITSRAMGLSYQLTAFGVVALYLLDHFKLFALSSAQILTAIMFFMYGSLFLILLILRRFGDVSE